MSPESPFISYARNREDVVLWRALRDVLAGRYVAVGADHPQDSVTKAFDDRRWSGTTIEPAQTGRLSELLEQHDGPDQIHFMLVDTEGAEEQVLGSVDLRAFRPWVLVVASTAPDSGLHTHQAWEPAVLEAGYVFCLFDGISRFYVAQEHAETLQARLCYPACVRDEFVEARVHAVLQEHEDLVEDVRRWRAEALSRWAEVSSADERHATEGDFGAIRRELEAMRASLSWRITRPLRAVRRRVGPR